MQIKHFRMGKLVIQDDNSQFYSVKVYDHKTKKSYGPAILTIPRDLYVAIERYIAAFREDVDEDDSVFEKKSLKGAVKIFNDFIKDLDLSETVFQPKDFRHMVSTWGANHQDEHVRQHVAEVQSHSQDVAEDYYDHNKQEMAAKIARQKSKDLGIGHSMPINETQAEINKRNEFVEAQKVQKNYFDPLLEIPSQVAGKSSWLRQVLERVFGQILKGGSLLGPNSTKKPYTPKIFS